MLPKFTMDITRFLPAWWRLHEQGRLRTDLTQDLYRAVEGGPARVIVLRYNARHFGTKRPPAASGPPHAPRVVASKSDHGFNFNKTDPAEWIARVEHHSVGEALVLVNGARSRRVGLGRGCALTRFRRHRA